MTGEASPIVIAWWAALSIISVVNLAGLVWLARKLVEEAPSLSPKGLRNARVQFALCAGYVIVCAFRSFLPRADVQRICLADTWLSAVMVGRAAATLAELCFVAQWAHLIEHVARRAGSRLAWRISKCVVPAIAIAEIFSWYAVLTTNYLGNAIEESIWATTGASCAIALFTLLRQKKLVVPRASVMSALGASIAYVGFMVSVDVPMYIGRWRADEAAGRAYLSLSAGIHHASSSWIVTRSLADWRDEMPWMFLYFTVAVWISLVMARVPTRWFGNEDEEPQRT